MHYVGTRMEVTLEHSDGTKTCLIDAGRYDFSWQRFYAYDGTQAELPRARPGDTVVIRCTYNNTMSNPNVVRALVGRLLGDPVEAEDVVQDVFVTAFARLATLREPGAFGAWVLRAAVRRVWGISKWRAVRRRFGLDHGAGIYLAPNPTVSPD